ncbi:MAG TPA: radical SAM protein, partial [Planctomycetota bacterium]|nr:radical SAM protein [Planctomycetota bacterium]
RGGKLYNGKFGERMRGQGPVAEQLKTLFELGCRQANLNHKRPPLNASAFRRPPQPLGTPDEPPLPLFV